MVSYAVVADECRTGCVVIDFPLLRKLPLAVELPARLAGAPTLFDWGYFCPTPKIRWSNGLRFSWPVCCALVGSPDTWLLITMGLER